MFLRIEETPNPNTIKFIPEEKLRYVGTKLYSASDNLEDSLLLKTIFSVEGVTTVLINSDFISVSKKESEDWAGLKTILSAKIGSALQENDKIFEKKEKENTNNAETPVEKEIINLLETKVKPVVASHGGDITFHSFNNGVVSLELKGSCSGCPSSTATLKMGIENMLKHYIPEVKEVIELSN
ncbi:NifU family protein [Alphaproteobacteria bacterium]|nr:NifU family protein [Alphaproteobacteria bacterium]